jgi:hypothetical protein
MTKGIKNMIKKRQKLLKNGKNSVEYSKYSNKVNKEIISRKKIYFDRKYTIGNPEWWDMINNFTKPPEAQIDTALANNINNGFYSVWNGEKQPEISHLKNRPIKLPTTPIFTPKKRL